MKAAIHDIPLINLLLAYSVLFVVLLIFEYYKTGLFKSTLISIGRMTVQLFFVALYLEYIFALNNAFVNSLWVAIMLIVSSFTTLKRSSLKPRLLFFPVLLAATFSLLLTDAFFLQFILKLEYVFESRYFIPISGMILGNIISYNVVGLNAYFSSIKREETLYHYLLVNSSRKKASFPFIKQAFVKSMSPYIATLSVIGLISLPGMMTGQILGGSPPAVAIKYQIMILLSIFLSGVVNLVLCILFINKVAFDDYGRIKKEIIGNM